MENVRYLKSPTDTDADRRDPAVAERVSEILGAIDRGGLDAVRRYSREIDDITVDGEDGWRSAHEFMRMLMPSQRRWRMRARSTEESLFMPP